MIIIQGIEKIRKLTKAEIETVYKEQMNLDFPPAEIKPLERILSLWEKGLYEVYGMYEEENLLGYAFLSTTKEKSWRLLDYYAIISKYRSKGYGGKFLSSLKKKLEEEEVIGLLIEIESIRSSLDEKERQVRERRQNFYFRNEIITTNRYATIFEMEYEILYYPFKEYETVQKIIEEYKKIYQCMLPTNLYEQNCKIDC